jgi:Ca2+/Na+ antiporter
MILIIIILFILFGFMALYFGSKLVIISLENIANQLGISH